MVCKQHSYQGFMPYSMQLICELKHDGSNKSDARKTAWNYLSEFIIELSNQGISVILGTYSNSNINNHNSEISTLMSKLNLHDVIKLSNTEFCTYPTYIQGQHRIDIILISADLKPAILH